MKLEPIRIGIVAPSSVIPKVEFEIGMEFLKGKGYAIEVHPSVFGEHYFYPASDEVRAEALIESALDNRFDALWCARGGYGATHLLPYLDRARKKLQAKKNTKKTLIGYSDATALLEWFRVNLGWNTIHAPMPSLRTFSILKQSEWDHLEAMLIHACRKKPMKTYSHALTPVFLPKNFKEVSAPLVGGNLFVWNTLLGTKNAGNARGKILFLEEIQENMARINRMLHHLDQTGGLKGVRAIVLGDFMDCPDSVPLCLKEFPTSENRTSLLLSPPREAMDYLRKVYSPAESLHYVFSTLGSRTGIPIFKGCPVGHGPNYHSLYLGKKHKILKNGKFSLV